MKQATVVYDSEGMVADVYACVDWKATPEETAEALNKKLAAHGLEIVQHNDEGGTEYFFTIVKKA